MNETFPITSALEKCMKYSKFPVNISHDHILTIFWGGICASIVLLWICGYSFARCINRRRRLLRYQRIWESESACKGHATELTDPRLLKKYRSSVMTAFVIAVVCTLLTAGLMVCIAFAGLNLQFCDGEELFFLVWSFWPLLALGAVVAEFGTCVYLLKILCKKKDEVPWGTAMGTPILILATLGYWFIRGVHTMLRSILPCLSPTDDADIGFPRSGTTSSNADDDDDDDDALATDAFVESEEAEEHQYDSQVFHRSKPSTPVHRVFPDTRAWKGPRNGTVFECPSPCCRARSLSF